MACTMYRMVEAPTNGTAGQIVDDFTLEALPAQFRELIEADPAADRWVLPATDDGMDGDPLPGLNVIVRRLTR